MRLIEDLDGGDPHDFAGAGAGIFAGEGSFPVAFVADDIDKVAGHADGVAAAEEADGVVNFLSGRNDVSIGAVLFDVSAVEANGVAHDGPSVEAVILTDRNATSVVGVAHVSPTESEVKWHDIAVLLLFVVPDGKDFGGDVVGRDWGDGGAGAFEDFDVIADSGLDRVVWGERSTSGSEVKPKDITNGGSDEQGNGDRDDMFLALGPGLFTGFAFRAS